MNFNNLALQCLFLISLGFQVNAQVGIGTTNPNESSALDITSTSSGILIPRIPLTRTTDIVTITGTEEESLLVYNTASVNDVTPGFYYWSGIEWVRLSTENPGDWGIQGNSNIDDNVHFFGTTTDEDIVFKTDNTDRMVLTSFRGQLIIGPELAGSSSNDLLKVAGDIEIGGGPLNFDSMSENITTNAQSEIWLSGVVNSPIKEEAYYFIRSSGGSAASPHFMIAQTGNVGMGQDDITPNDILHVVDDKPSATRIRIDNTNDGTNITHMGLRLYDGSDRKASFDHNNFTNVLEIGHEETTGTVELKSGGGNTMILERDQSVTINNHIKFQPRATPLLPADGTEGDIYYDFTTHTLKVFDGTAWVDLH